MIGNETARDVTALWCAARSGHSRVVTSLASLKADVSDASFMHQIILNEFKLKML